MLKSFMVIFDNDYEMFHRSRIEVRKSIQENLYEEDKVKANEVLFQLEEGRRALLKNVMQVSFLFILVREIYKKMEPIDGK